VWSVWRRPAATREIDKLRIVALAHKFTNLRAMTLFAAFARRHLMFHFPFAKLNKLTLKHSFARDSLTLNFVCRGRAKYRKWRCDALRMARPWQQRRLTPTQREAGGRGPRTASCPEIF
jgi:hypothetical protein